MKFSFTMSQLKNHAVNYHRAWEFVWTLRNAKQIPSGQSFGCREALQAIQAEECLRVDYQDPGCFLGAEIVVFDDDESGFFYDIVVHSLKVLIAWDDFQIALGKLHRKEGTLVEAKKLLEVFKDLLEQTEL